MYSRLPLLYIIILTEKNYEFCNLTFIQKL